MSQDLVHRFSSDPRVMNFLKIHDNGCPFISAELAFLVEMLDGGMTFKIFITVSK